MDSIIEVCDCDIAGEGVPELFAAMERKGGFVFSCCDWRYPHGDWHPIAVLGTFIELLRKKENWGSAF